MQPAATFATTTILLVDSPHKAFGVDPRRALSPLFHKALMQLNKEKIDTRVDKTVNPVIAMFFLTNAKCLFGFNERYISTFIALSSIVNFL
jgi:hypothetical protein